MIRQRCSVCDGMHIMDEMAHVEGKAVCIECLSSLVRGAISDRERRETQDRLIGDIEGKLEALGDFTDKKHHNAVSRVSVAVKELKEELKHENN